MDTSTTSDRGVGRIQPSAVELRLLLGTDHEYARRANDAADWLVERAGNSSTVVAVTHGGFRRIVADRLAARGWRAPPGLAQLRQLERLVVLARSLKDNFSTGALVEQRPRGNILSQPIVTHGSTGTRISDTVSVNT